MIGNPWCPARQPHAFAVVAFSLLFALGCRWSATDTTPASDDSEPSGPSLFQDVTTESGINFQYRNGEEADQYTMLETLGGGLAVLDIDGDGRLDLFLTGGGRFEGQDKQQIKGNPCRLYRNCGNFRFEDVTAAWGLDRIDFYSHGVAVADYDRDGRPDLLVTGWHKLALFHNTGRTFVAVDREAGLPEGLWTTSAAWGDLDGDGFPDLYVCQYVDWSFERHHPPHCNFDGHTRDVCPPKLFAGLEHKLFRNNGDGTFEDVSKKAGLRVARSDAELARLTWLPPRSRERLKRVAHEGDTRFGKGLGVLFVDVNDDGKPDIYVANDTVDNFLYVNRSLQAGQVRFEELGFASGTARDAQGEADGSMGLASSDFNHSGKPSLWVANYENEYHALYRNDCTRDHIRFAHSTRRAGLAVFGRLTVGWGTGFFDIDHHGAEDLFLVTGHVLRVPQTIPRYQMSILARNDNGRFRNISEQGGSYFRVPHLARGAVSADFDNDGRVDLAISHVNDPVVLLRNEADTAGRHWLGVELHGKGHRDVVGAKLILEAAGQKQTRFAQGGGSYASSSDRRQVFGLGSANRIDALTVEWPDRQRQRFSDLELDRYYRLTQGEDKAVPLTASRPQE